MTPTKPFDTYKWRWLSTEPTESLLVAPVFLGVLRVMSRHEGEAPATAAIADELQVVRQQTRSPVNLARTVERNIIRNSGQYWKGTGLLSTQAGPIQLTRLGKDVASGVVSSSEFAAIMVQQTVLPNPWTYSDAEIGKWQAANLKIRPLALILAVIDQSGLKAGVADAYLTPHELIRVVIPLAGVQATVKQIADHVLRFRAGMLDVSAWPDCAPAANDHRLAREFLLFLSNFGLCRRESATPQRDEKYHVDQAFDPAILIAHQGSIFGTAADQEAAISAARGSALPSQVGRQRVLTSVLSRPGQAKFRDDVLSAYGGRCHLSGESISDVLEAAHIVPVQHEGADVIGNGFCLRVDLHRLLDAGHLRIRPTGDLSMSAAMAASANYKALPAKIAIPPFVLPANLAWRDSYL